MLYSRPFLMMATANFFTASSFGAMFLFPLFVTDQGGSTVDIGIMMSAFTLASVISRFWISEMIDRFGRRRSYTLGTLVMTLAPPTYLFFQGDLYGYYPIILVVRLLHGVGLALCFTAAFTYVADIVPRERLNEGIGMFGVSGLSGIAIGPVIGEVVILGGGFPTYFVATAGTAALGFFLHLGLPESYVSVSHESPQRFLEVLVKPRVLAVTVLALLFGFGLAATNGFVAPFARQEQVSPISVYFLSYSATAVLTRLFGGKLADRVGESRVIPYALLLTGLGLLGLVFLGGLGVLAMAGLMSGAGHGLLFPCLNARIIRDQPIAIRGKITGIFTGGIDAGSFSGSLALGYLGAWAGYRAIFLAAGLALVAGVFIHRLQDRGGRRAAAAKGGEGT